MEEDAEQVFFENFVNDFIPKPKPPAKKRIHTWKQYLIAK
jgi:hypothetical protein